jgi:tetratricopeptide (TPR) repeat protein
MGDFDAAIQTLLTYASLIPDEPNPQDSLGEIYLMAGRYDESIARYSAALEIDPKFYSSYTGRGHAHLFQGHRDESLREYEEMARTAPTEGVRREALRWKAVALAGLGETDVAIETLHDLRATLIEADEVLSAGNRALDIGWMSIYGGDYTAGKDILDDAWRTVMASDLRETAKVSYARRHHVVSGVCRARMGDLSGARELAARIERLVSESQDMDEWQDYNWLMGEILLIEEEYPAAVANLMHGPQENPRVLYQLGVALEKRGRRAEARRTFEKIQEWNRPGLQYALIRPLAESALMARAEVP